VLERERCGDFKVFISPFRFGNNEKNLWNAMIWNNEKQVALNDYQKGGGK
jgi:hypothetical protein